MAKQGLTKKFCNDRATYFGNDLLRNGLLAPGLYIDKSELEASFLVTFILQAR